MLGTILIASKQDIKCTSKRMRNDSRHVDRLKNLRKVKKSGNNDDNTKIKSDSHTPCYHDPSSAQLLALFFLTILLGLSIIK